MNFEIKGELLKKYDTNVVSDRFKKREFVLSVTETNSSGSYTETLLFQMTQDRCNMLDSFVVGEIMTVGFGLKGRAWTKQGETEPRYFNNLEAWKLTHNKDAQSNIVDTSYSTEIPDESDDLPF